MTSPAGTRFCSECGAALTPAATPSLKRSDAQRRHMTVMFCDLVGSTPLAERLDPEDFHELLLGYQELCATSISRFNGYTALYVGDGVVAYFGYPRAHEDDAQRATHAALGILEGLGELNQRLKASFGETINVRIGLHSGVVVVAENFGEQREQHEIIGETPHIAQRLESIAAHGSVVMSDTTRTLVEGYFELEPLGERELKGISRPIQVHRVVRATGAVGRLDAADAASLTPLVGRAGELDRLLEAWLQAASGSGTIAEITGEAGIGKSRLVRALLERLEPELGATQVWQCSAHHAGTSLHPLIRLLERELGLDRSATEESQLDAIGVAATAAGLNLAEALPLLADLLAVGSGNGGERLELTPRDARSATLRVLESMLVADPEKHPLLIVVEDLHWADPTTLEFLDRIARRVTALPVMCVLTFRRDFTPGWRRRRPVLELELARLSSDEVRTMAASGTEGELDSKLLEWLDAAADGVPLFVEEMLRMLELDAGMDQLIAGEPGSHVPPTLHGMLTERLDRLGPLGELVDVAAVLGREFDRELLVALEHLSEAEILLGLAQLTAHGVLRPVAEQARLEFSHALLQEAAYDRMLRRRRRELHARVAEVLVEEFPDLAEREPEVVAAHWSAANQPAKSTQWWYDAGVRALSRAAFVEAAEHFRRGSEALERIDPDGRNRARRFAFATHLGAALQAGQGYGTSSVGEAYAQAREYCDAGTGGQQLTPVIRGQWMFNLVRGEYATALERSNEMLELASRDGGEDLEREGQLYSGLVQMYLGKFDLARSNLEQAMTSHDRRAGADEIFEAQGDTRVGALAYLSMVLWQLGHDEASRRYSDQSLELAERIAGPVTRAQAFFMRTILHLARGEIGEFATWVERTRAYSAEHGIGYWRILSTAYSAWRQAWSGELAAGTARLRSCIDAYLRSGSKLGVAYLYLLLADLELAGGNVAGAEAELDAAAEYIESSGERFSESELYRARARALMARDSPDHAGATVALEHAVEVAASQNARMPELRALAQLVAHRRKLGEPDEHDAERLSALCDWFGPTGELPDVVRARSLLERPTGVA
ncbi:MAG TPA: adenylate/guanylate cyclase domain-containing protein [Solirubrobacteraceae bacterium]|nr:adenylate/guanylate cyclase domain-containing protein [Solirubrobacteraceae bacterium]